MPGHDFYRRVDDLSGLPPLAAQNYGFELEWLVRELPQGAQVLQVGSHDGRRALALLSERPDLTGFTGLELEPQYAAQAQQLLDGAKLNAKFVMGDITDPPRTLSGFDYVLCLNNTLSYIPQTAKAIEQMKRLGGTVVVSVFGETFNEKLAREYFSSIGSVVSAVEATSFRIGNFAVHRFTRQEVEAWGGVITETPLGYLARIG